MSHLKKNYQIAPFFIFTGYRCLNPYTIGSPVYNLGFRFLKKIQKIWIFQKKNDFSKGHGGNLPCPATHCSVVFHDMYCHLLK